MSIDNKAVEPFISFAEFQRAVLSSNSWHAWAQQALILAYNQSQITPVLGKEQVLCETFLRAHSKDARQVARMPLRLLIDRQTNDESQPDASTPELSSSAGSGSDPA